MLTSIELENFKCFSKKSRIPLGAINLFTGINGRGKSTALQALLLMRQSLEHNRNTDQVILNGGCVSLGNFDDVRSSERPRNDPITIKFLYQFDEVSAELTYTLVDNPQDEMVADIEAFLVDFSPKQDDYQIGYRPSSSLLHFSVYNRDTMQKYLSLYWNNLSVATNQSDDEIYDQSPAEVANLVIHLLNDVEFRKTHYISADRLGPQDFYPKQSFAEFPNVGTRGEYTANVLAKKQFEQVDVKLCLETGSTDTVLDQTEAWLDFIFGGARLTIDQPHANIVLMALNAERNLHSYKPINVGFGYSYALPIIVSGLVAKAGERLLVENPEAHLHPYAQSQLAKFLAKVSAIGVQVFIESHSDHILNALRVAVLDKVIASSDLNVLYFSRAAEVTIEQIPVNADGSIEVWPVGFFDQTDKDFERLFGV